MKPIYIYTFAILSVGLASCANSGSDIPVTTNEQEIELTIVTSGQSTRFPVPDPGVARERQIDELDLLIFKDDKYQYSRQAFKISGYTYKANLKVDNATLTAYVFANCRSYLTNWELSGTQANKSWATVWSELVDANPPQWVSDQGKVLPMWGTASGTVSQTHVSGWGTVDMLRSVASVDAYVEQNGETDRFILTDAHLYYAPDKGYLAPEPDGNGYKLSSPADMQTQLNTLKASGTSIVSMEDAGGGTVIKDGIANQLYLYDNDINASNYSPDTPPIRKYTRLILVGYYDQPDPVYIPEEPGVDKRKKTYYPLDFVDDNGDFHDIKRNYKYVFNISSVNGEGYGSLEEAADEYPINMDMNVIEWNRHDEHIGVQGKYYLTMKRRDVVLWSKAGATDQLKLSYEILDNTPGESFRIAFTTENNGVQRPPTGTSPWPAVIENDHFKVSLVHNTAEKTADFIVEALTDHTYGNDTDMVEVRFRDLKFYISITQMDRNGWEDGGEIPADI